jgi:hypothetical protein
MGIVVDASGFLITFDLNESNESLPQVQRWFAARRAVDIVRTDFSEQEIAKASRLELVPDWHRGYPQPNEGVFGYLEVTYDIAQYWIFDEYFVTPAVWTKVFEPHCIRCRHVQDTSRIYA